jgi:hypothetical protein
MLIRKLVLVMLYVFGGIEYDLSAEEIPTPLRFMCDKAQIIGVATCIGIDTTKIIDCPHDTRAQLHFGRIIKGNKKDSIITSHLFTGLVCPEPARLWTGDIALVFLCDYGKESGAFDICANHRGAKHLNEDAMNVYIERIEEYFQIPAEDPDRKEQLIEWLVKCAVDSVTRWEGVYDLAANWGIKVEPEPSTILTFEQQQRMYEAILSMSKIYDIEMTMLSFVDELVDKRIQSQLIDYITRRYFGHHVGNAMIYLSKLLNLKEGLLIANKYNQIKWGSSRYSEQTRLIEEFKIILAGDR